MLNKDESGREVCGTDKGREDRSWRKINLREMEQSPSPPNGHDVNNHKKYLCEDQQDSATSGYKACSPKEMAR